MAAAIPGIEIADHGHPPGGRRQHREGRPLDAVHDCRMRAELLVEAVVIAFRQEIDVLLAQHRAEAIGVLFLPALAAMGELQAIGVVGLQAGHVARMEAVGTARFQLAQELARLVHDRGRLGTRPEDAHDRAAVGLARSEHAEGIAVNAAADGIDLMRVGAMVGRSGRSAR